MDDRKCFQAKRLTPETAEVLDKDGAHETEEIPAAAEALEAELLSFQNFCETLHSTAGEFRTSTPMPLEAFSDSSVEEETAGESIWSMIAGMYSMTSALFKIWFAPGV